MLFEDFEEEPVTLKDKILRFFVGVFLFILISTLIILLLPGDAERSLLNLLTGQELTSAGNIGDEAIPIDSFKSARIECYNLYHQYMPDRANDAGLLNECAYNRLRSMKVDKVLAGAAGFYVSDIIIKEDLSKQAREAYKRNSSAGYAADEMKSPEEIYRILLHSAPISYRQDAAVSSELYERFLNSNLAASADETRISNEIQTVKLSIAYVVISDEELLNSIGDNFPVSDEEIKKDYDDSVAKGTVPKDANGKPETLENRKAFIFAKLKSEIKQKKLSDLKAQILSARNTKGAGLSEVAKVSGSKVQEMTKVSLMSLGADKKQEKFLSNSGFLKDLTTMSFGKGDVGGPYSDGDKSVYVEFKDLVIEAAPAAVAAASPDAMDKNSMKVRRFLNEIKQSLNGLYPVNRKLDKSVE